jgi:F420H(2)-dependent quinone reductase
VHAERLEELSWSVMRRLMGGHALVYRATGGLVGHHIPGVPPMLLLDTVGAKSGTKRTTPLVYVEEGDDVAVIASKGGHPKHPGWFHNLLAHPDTTVQIGRDRRAVHARVPDPEERARLWAKAVAVWPSYRDYQARTEREIPIVILERRA